MKRSKSKLPEKTGLPPGSLIHVGTPRTGHTVFSVMDYDKSNLREEKDCRPDICFPYKDRETTTWIHVMGIHNIEPVKQIGQYFNLHPLILEDILNTEQRPKIDEYSDYIFMTLKIFQKTDENQNITVEQLSIVLSEHFVISFQESNTEYFEPIKKRIRNGMGRIRNMGSDYLAYALIDTIVDLYISVTDSIEDDLENMEERLMNHTEADIIHELYDRRREIIYFRRLVLSLRDMVFNLKKSDSPLVSESTHIFLKDLYDHTIHVVDMFEIFRELTVGLLDLHNSALNNRMNQVMKVLTIIATIFIPLTFIAGIYGMNFQYMPELQWKWGYPLIWGIIAVVALSMLLYFKKKRWL